MSHTHSLSEWMSAGSLGLSAISLIALALAFADADFDPRPLLARAHQLAVFAARDLDRAVAAVRHELAPHAMAVRHAVYGGREIVRDLAALLLLLTTSPKGALR